MRNLLKVLLSGMALALSIGEAFGQFVWTKDARNPVLPGGASGAWNAKVGSPCVLFNADSGRYEMWFSAYRVSRPYSIGRAISTDGISWTMDASPVLTPSAGTWDASSIDEPMVIRDDSGHYKMWYESWLTPTSPGYMGYATSPDGIQWTKYSGNPVMGPGTAAWEAGGPWSCFVMPVYPPGGYRAWYSATDAAFIKGGIGYATSADGIVWVKDTVNNPVLRDSLGQWDDTQVGSAEILHIAGSKYYMWYAAYPSSSFASRDVGLAISNDGGATWTKYSGNPVLKHSPGAWDGSLIACGTVLPLPGADSLVMWYEALQGVAPTPSRIGRAVSPLIDVGVSEWAESNPTESKLFQNYPNPFNPSTTIRYELPKSSMVRLSVYDMLGREVIELVNQRRDAGVHEVQFDGSTLASGVYVYRLQAGDFVHSRTLVLLR